MRGVGDASPALRRFDYRQLMNLLSSRGVGSTCTACGRDDWIHGDGLVFMAALDEDGVVDPGSGVAVAAFFCRSCGFSRFFAPDAIDARTEN